MKEYSVFFFFKIRKQYKLLNTKMLEYLKKSRNHQIDMPTTFHHCIVGSSEYSKTKRNNSKNVETKS